MKYPELIRTIKWENDEVRLIQLVGLATGPGKYTRIKNRPVEATIVHQAAGNPLAGEDAPVRLAKFHAAPPKYKHDVNGNLVYRTIKGKKKPWWVGGGRGWPGIGYQFVIPTYPELQDGKIVIYQTHDEDVWSWHTSGAINRRGLGIVLAGCFRSEHDPHSAIAVPRPDPLAITALDALLFEYLLPKHNLKAEEGLYGHFDFGKAACPGDYLEQWVRFKRGESLPDPDETFLDDPDPVPTAKKPVGVVFKTVKERQEALLKLGYDLGKWGADGSWGTASRGALLAFQDNAGLVSDGVWGPKTDAAIVRALAELEDDNGDSD